MERSTKKGESIFKPTNEAQPVGELVARRNYSVRAHPQLYFVAI